MLGSNVFLALLLLSVLATGNQFDYNMAALQRHNYLRAGHGAQALTLDSTLMFNALRCAKYYVETGAPPHTCPFKFGAGENIRTRWTTGGPDSDVAMAVEATNWWYDEVLLYNYRWPVDRVEYRHFTQLVWKPTNRLGVGVYSVRRGYETDTVIVALYTPAGNVLGEFARNV